MSSTVPQSPLDSLTLLNIESCRCSHKAFGAGMVSFVPRGNLKTDTMCRLGTDSGDRTAARGELAGRDVPGRQEWWLAGRSEGLRFDGGLVDQHDRDVIFDGIDAVTLCAFQTLRVGPVFEGLDAGGTDQDFEEIFGNHDEHCTIETRAKVSKFQGFKVSE